MRSQIIQENLIINQKKRVGDVLIIIEGEKDERKAFENIFGRILGYATIHIGRNGSIIKTKYYQAESGSTIYIANTDSSSINSILDASCRDRILSKICKELDGKSLKYVRTYYVWDRDRESNTEEKVEEAVATFCNSQDNDELFEGGLLCLSFPCYEAYQISNFYYRDLINGHPKDYITNKLGKRAVSPSKFSIKTLKRATMDMLRKMEEMGIEFNLDEIPRQNIEIFNTEEACYKQREQYLLFSEISMILLDLGIIETMENGTK